MPKTAIKRARPPGTSRAATINPAETETRILKKKADSGSKQSRIITMLQSPTGMTVAAMMQETDWQQHSVRGFLAGVVRKKMKLKLVSEKIDGTRIYRIDGTDTKANRHPAKRRAV